MPRCVCQSSLTADALQKWAKQEPASKRRLDILINNAGALSNAKATSKQGHEFTCSSHLTAQSDSADATNVLGAFVLTLSLLRFMPENARVVWTSSIALLGAYPVRPDNLDDQAYLGSLREGKRYPVTHALQLYMNSKASMALLSRVLAKRLKSPGIVSLAVNPGAVRTSICAYRVARSGADRAGRRPGYGDVSISALGARWIDVIGIRPQQGGQPLVFAAVDPSAAALSGQYVRLRFLGAADHRSWTATSRAGCRGGTTTSPTTTPSSRKWRRTPGSRSSRRSSRSDQSMYTLKCTYTLHDRRVR